MSTTPKLGERGDAVDDRWRLEFWPLDRLVPSPRNARTHSEAQIAEIAGSIRAFGLSNPILISEDGDVIAGHDRLAAARQLGLAEVPVIGPRPGRSSRARSPMCGTAPSMRRQSP